MAGRRWTAAVLSAGLVVAWATGSSGGQPIPRIVGGGKANGGGWQFTVALEQKRRLICSGSLIAPRTVLTAAHCAKGGKRRQLSVLAGSPSISPNPRRLRIKVVHVVLDPAYNGRKDSHDFAVLTLASAPPVRPVVLATSAEGGTATQPGRIVRSAGFGTRSAWGFNVARRLKVTKERVYRARKCDLSFGKARGFDGRSMICTLGKRVRRFRSRLRFHATSCEGDSGGPLVGQTPDGPRLVGVVSAGTFPCGLGGPSIYARVANRLGFIRSEAGLG